MSYNNKNSLIIIIFDKEEAIDVSIRYPNRRVEIFSENDNFGYPPGFNYYKKIDT